MDVNSRIHIGHIYSLNGMLLRYDGAYQSYPEKGKCVMCHKFTTVKPINRIIGMVRPWEQYTATSGRGDRHEDCIYLYREAFQYIEYNPTLTVLYGNSK